MTRQQETRLAQVCQALNRHGARYVVVGPAAMQLWGYTRATRDVDILIEQSLENGERVLAGLSEIGFGLAREWLAKDIVAKPVSIIGDNPRVNVLTVAWTLHYPETARDATTFTVEGIEVPAASIEHLIVSKRTGRLQDAADIEALEEIRRLRQERGEDA